MKKLTREYNAIVWVGDENSKGERVTVFATDLDNAKEKFSEADKIVFPHIHVFK